MNNILVPCDFSDPSIQAFKFAVDIARHSRGVVHLLNVVELPVLYDSAAVLSFEQAFMADLKKEAEKNFGKLKQKYAKGSPSIKTHVEYGATVSVIRRLIPETKADLVVLGTHGASGLKDFTVGSNTEKIVRTSTVPVIALKKETKGIKTIVFPTIPDMEQEDLMMRVKELQNFFDATLHIVYVNTPGLFKRDMEMKSALKDFAKRFMLKNYTVNIFNDITQEEGIANFAREVKADMIAMRTHGRRGISHLAMGSIAEDIVNHIDCPIWTYVVK